MNINQIIQNLAEYGGVYNIGTTVTSSNTTAANSTSGNISFQILPLVTGTFGSTQEDINFCGSEDQLNQSLEYANVGGTGGGIARIYEVGYCDFNLTGSRFTRTAGTLPLLRTVMGQSNAAVAYIPFIMLAAPIGTAPSFTVDYVAADGTPTTGTLVTTLPASAVTGSCFFLRLEDQGSAVQDITDIVVSSASSTSGTTYVYMMELLSHGQDIVQGASVYDTLVGSGARFTVLQPATPTSGSIDSWVVCVNYSTTAATNSFISVGFS